MSLLSRSLLFLCVVGALGCNAQKPGALPDAASYMKPTGGPAREVKITVRDYQFTPSQIVAKPGERLTLVVQSQGNQEHGMTFDLPPGAVSAPQHLLKGESMRYQVVVPNVAGSYNFYCPVGDHYSRGMMGQIVARQ